MLIGKSKIEIPDDCPEGCKFGDESFFQGNMCSRCPIFNCKKTPCADPSYSDKDGFFQLLKPEEYGDEWAKEWKKYFDTMGMKEVYYPQLYFNKGEKK